MTSLSLIGNKASQRIYSPSRMDGARQGAAADGPYNPHAPFITLDGVAAGRIDAASGYFFLRELEQILAEQLNVKFAELKGLRMVPQDNSIDPGAESVSWSMFNAKGKARRITQGSDDFPLVNVHGEQSTAKMFSYGAAFTYDIAEIRAANFARRSLERDRVDAVRKVIDQKLDEIAAVGDSDTGSLGLLNLTGTDTYVVPVGQSNSKLWVDKTSDEILKDMNGMIAQVITNTLEVERPTRLVMPTAQLELISNTARSPVSDTTILEFFKGNRPDVEVLSWERLAGAGAASTDRMVAYDPRPMQLKMLNSILFQMYPPQLKNAAYIVNCECRTGGVINPYPKSIIYGDGI